MARRRRHDEAHAMIDARTLAGSLLFAVLAACGSSSKGGDVADGGAGGSNGGDAEGAPDGGAGAVDAGPDATTPASADATSSADSETMPDVVLPADAQWLGGGSPDAAERTYTVVNQCTETVWAAALPATTFPGGLVEMAPGYAFAVGVAEGWSGRIWGKTGCTTVNGKTTCASDAYPASLAELTLDSTAAGQDFYDVSLVDGFNLPIELIADGHTPDAGHPYDCGEPGCAVDLNATCPAPLRDIVGGSVLACANDECKVLGGNDAASPDCIYPNDYTRFFKDACPTAYSYPYDDPTSTFTCAGINSYTVVFCP
jgi:hypothetical protein